MMDNKEETMIYIHQLGKLIDEYYSAPHTLKQEILKDIRLLADVIYKEKE